MAPLVQRVAGVLFLIAWLAAEIPATNALADRSLDRMVTYYDNGRTVTVPANEIKRLQPAPPDPELRLVAGWDQLVLYAARRYTFHLLPLTSSGWDDIVAGNGLQVRDARGDTVATYAGQMILPTGTVRASVDLIVWKKNKLAQAYKISMFRPWPGGPWLVESVAPTPH